MEFLGYRRTDGSVGIRNHVLILPIVGCALEVCRQAAGQLNGAVSFINQNGCGETMKNLKLTQTIISGLALNPNIYGVVCVGIGCEINTMDYMLDLIRSKSSKSVEGVSIQKEGGSIDAVAKVTKLAQKMISDASECIREECDISELTLGVECGGSDASSGLAANPVMGYVSDRLVEMGGTSMFSETSEMIGAEHLLAKRACSPYVSQRILDTVKKREQDMKALGEDIRLFQPSPGNKAGGITTLEEKSLGCIYKGGTSPVMEFVEYGQRPTKKGLILMDTPAYDLNSVTAKVAGGCQMVVFTTGRGNTLGNPIAPVVKATANKDTYRRMQDNMDCDFSPVISGEASIEQIGESALNDIVKFANGKLTKAEIYKFGFCETVISRVCDYL